MLQYAHRTPGRKRSHWHPNLAACLRRMVFSVRLNRSTAPSHCGWYAVVFNLVIPSIRHRSSIKLDTRLVPLSESRHSGTPNNGITSSAISLEIRAVFWSGTVKHRPLSKQILYHHYVLVALVCYRKVHNVNAQNLEWSGYRDGMQRWPVHSTTSHDNGTLRAGLRKLLGIAKHPFPLPSSSQCVVEALAREVARIGAGVGSRQYLLTQVLWHSHSPQVFLFRVDEVEDPISYCKL